MKMDVFMDKLTLALTERGVPAENAAKHAEALRRSFDSDDLSEIEAMNSSDEIEALADSLSAILKRKQREKAAANSAQTAQAEQSVQPAQEEVPDAAEKATKTDAAAPIEHKEDEPRKIDAVPELHPAPPAASGQSVVEVRQAEIAQAASPQTDHIEDEIFEVEAQDKVTTRGMAIFWCGLFVLSPVILGLAAAGLMFFGGLYVGLAALSAALIVGMIAVIAGGAVISLVGIIYGITQLFSFVEAGIYEIGLGIAVAGAALLISVLMFNLAIRLLPFIIKKVGVFFRFVVGKIKEAFFAIRRECYKL